MLPSCGSGSDAIDATVEFPDAVIHLVHARPDSTDGSVELAFIDSVRCFHGITDVVDDIAAHADVVVFDGDVFRRIFILNRQSAIVDGRVARRD